VALTLALSTVAGAQSARYYQIGWNGGPIFDDPDEIFVVQTADPYVISVAEADLRLPPMERRHHVDGQLGYEDYGRYNFDGNKQPNEWGWDFTPGQWQLMEYSIELCDGRPSDWDGGNHFCPWNSYVRAPVLICCELKHFEAEVKLEENIFQAGWVTLQEVDASHFELQLTGESEPIGFQTVVTVPARGELGGARYGRVIQFPLRGHDVSEVRYARLKCVDRQGRYIYSDLRDFWLR
jgi:hypothetical protein